MDYDEFTDDLVNRSKQVEKLLKRGMSLEEAIQIAFCLEKTEARNYIGRFFAEMFAELMNYEGRR